MAERLDYKSAGAKRRFYCKCGEVFDSQRFITEHIGICNPHWPRTTDEDEHRQVTSDEWQRGKGE